MPLQAVETHSKFREIIIHTAKCDLCELHNKDKLYTCCSCNINMCTPCIKSAGRDDPHVLNEDSTIIPAPPMAKGKGKTKKRPRESEGNSCKPSNKAPSTALSSRKNLRKHIAEGKETDKGKSRQLALVDGDETESDKKAENMLPLTSIREHKLHDPDETESDFEMHSQPTIKRQCVKQMIRKGRRRTQDVANSLPPDDYELLGESDLAGRTTSMAADSEAIEHADLASTTWSTCRDPRSPQDISYAPRRHVSHATGPLLSGHGFLTPPAHTSPASNRHHVRHRRSRSDGNLHVHTEEDMEAAEILTDMSRSSESRSPRDRKSGDSDAQHRHQTSSPPPPLLASPPKIERRSHSYKGRTINEAHQSGLTKRRLFNKTQSSTDAPSNQDATSKRSIWPTRQERRSDARALDIDDDVPGSWAFREEMERPARRMRLDENYDDDEGVDEDV